MPFLDLGKSFLMLLHVSPGLPSVSPSNLPNGKGSTVQLRARLNCVITCQCKSRKGSAVQLRARLVRIVDARAEREGPFSSSAIGGLSGSRENNGHVTDCLSSSRDNSGHVADRFRFASPLNGGNIFFFFADRVRFAPPRRAPLGARAVELVNTSTLPAITTFFPSLLFLQL